MDNTEIDIKIEVKRALLKICNETLMGKLMPAITDFYCKLFFVYGLEFKPEVIKQKRQFVTKATEYYIFEALPKSLIKKEKDKYKFVDLQSVSQIQEQVVTVTEFVCNYGTPEELEEEYSKNFHVKKKSLAKDLAANREDNLSDFAKAIEKIYNYKEDENSQK